jgi:hypothetical protein
MKTKFVSISLFLLFINSCTSSHPDEEFTMTRSPYSGKEIRLDGCYISESGEQANYCAYKFFYSNGIVFSLGDLPNIDNTNQFTGGIDSARKNKYFWGVFQIENNTITVQQWRFSNSEFIYQLIVKNEYYKIINDTILSIDYLGDGDITNFHFKRFMPRPDSTNVFIK